MTDMPDPRSIVERFHEKMAAMGARIIKNTTAWSEDVADASMRVAEVFIEEANAWREGVADRFLKDCDERDDR